MSTELTVQSERQTLTVMDLKKNHNKIQEVMKSVMKKDVHWGAIPGCGDKPALLKAGAETLFSTFMIGIEDPIIKDMSDGDEIRYIIIVRGIYTPTGNFLGSGIGECSSKEDKFNWRNSVCDEEFNDTPEDRRRIKWRRGKENKPYTIKQIRENISDKANTVLKMAVKRAKVDLCFSVLACSDLFVNGEEPIEDHLERQNENPPTINKPVPINQGSHGSESNIPHPQVSDPSSPQNNLLECYVTTVKEVTGKKKDGSDYSKYVAETSQGNFSTFSKTYAETFKQAIGKHSVFVKYSENKYGKTAEDVSNTPY
jgi:hypothetical protein